MVRYIFHPWITVFTSMTYGLLCCFVLFWDSLYILNMSDFLWNRELLLDFLNIYFLLSKLKWPYTSEFSPQNFYFGHGICHFGRGIDLKNLIFLQLRLCSLRSYYRNITIVWDGRICHVRRSFTFYITLLCMKFI
jgi:hypothetical protein